MGVRILSRQSGVQSTLVPVRSSKGCGAPWIHHALRWKQAKNIFLNLIRPRQGIITCMATKNNKTSGILRDGKSKWSKKVCALNMLLCINSKTTLINACSVE